MAENLTAAQRRALEILRDNGPLLVGQFADLMWPVIVDKRKSPSYRRKPQGSGFAGGGYLAKLRRLGLVEDSASSRHASWLREYRLSAAGRAALAPKEK